ncbi:MAG TPA: hypothetical protein VJT49_24010 [Amycolatopsis sp.]|uniref:DUF6880 family protein n=1 Tax=Amycolatopsis sp. TaxID=37632 RepID=UPI002B462188|nr:DUF6880 family protein [Amycolatopsis sp.]HKS48118.1 hypothetical protein [Amycolatopsis sp.]
MTDLRRYLHSLDVETLADLLHEQAERDPELHTRLLQRAGEAGGDLAEVSSLLDGAVSGRYHGSSGEAAKIGAVLDTLQRLLDSGTQADVAPLARRAVDRIGKALEHLDDSSGVVRAELGRAVVLYARACAAHPPRPEDLADWILGVEFGGGGWPKIPLADFAEALGTAGLARIQSKVDDVLAETRSGLQARRTAERLNEQLAEISGNVDALLEMLSGQLPRLDVSLKIVRVLRAAGRTTEAIAHAAKALAHGTGPARGPVVDALAETFEETGQRDELLTLRRAEFERAPTLRTYLALREAAADPDRWGAEREQALDVFRERAENNSFAADELARALLAEEQPEEAWQAAVRYACSLRVRLELAELREAGHPEEAISVYRRHIEELIEHKDADHYREAAKRLRKLRTVYRRAGQAGEFGDYLAELVRTHKRKARLLAEIRNARIALPKS